MAKGNFPPKHHHKSKDLIFLTSRIRLRFFAFGMVHLLFYLSCIQLTKFQSPISISNWQSEKCHWFKNPAFPTNARLCVLWVCRKIGLKFPLVARRLHTTLTPVVSDRLSYPCGSLCQRLSSKSRSLPYQQSDRKNRSRHVMNPKQTPRCCWRCRWWCQCLQSDLIVCGRS